MPSRIDQQQPVDGEPVSKAKQRANWTAAKAELEHGGFFAQAGAGAIERTAQEKLRELAVSVKDFGASGNGATDDTPAIRAAIHHVGARGGGTVYLPAGAYKIMPQQSREHALYVSWSNVALVGDGMGATRLLFRCFNDADPRNGYEVIPGADPGTRTVWRGHGIEVTSPTPDFDRNVPIRNLVFRDFELDGGIADANQGIVSFPADPQTGDGWDVTHKGITLPSDRASENILFERVHVHRFRGELLYRGGGDDCRRVTIRECRVGATNANGINIGAADRHVSDTEVYDCYNAAFEDVLPGDATFHRLRIRRCGWGILFGALRGVSSKAVVSDCLLEDCPHGGIVCLMGNAIITGNVLVDCGSQHADGRALSVATFLPDVIQWEPGRRGVVVQGNVVLARRKRVEWGIHVAGSAESPCRDVLIANNVLARDPENSEDFHTGLRFGLSPDCRGVVVRGNIVDGAHYFLGYVGADAVTRVPLIAPDNSDRSLHIAGELSPAIHADRTQPLVGPSVRFNSQIGAGATPTINPALYEPGYRVTVRGYSDFPQPIVIPRRAPGWCLQEDREIWSGCELTVEFDGERFCEVNWIDKR